MRGKRCLACGSDRLQWARPELHEMVYLPDKGKAIDWPPSPPTWGIKAGQKPCPPEAEVIAVDHGDRHMCWTCRCGYTWALPFGQRADGRRVR